MTSNPATTSIQLSTSFTPSSTITSSTSSSSRTPSNAPIVQGYAYDGCLGSRDNYPSFTLVATESDMTVQRCIEMSPGSKYVGINEQSCYKADSLNGTEFVVGARCDILCPGDPDSFCGGNVGQERRRSVPSNRLLTIYTQAVSSSSSSSYSSLPPISSSSTTHASSSYSSSSSSFSAKLGTSTSNASSATSKGKVDSTLSGSASSFESITQTSQPPSLTHLSSIEPTRTIHVTKDVTMTVFTETTVTYVTVDTVDPGVMVTTCVSIDLLYIPCGCEEQVYPSVEMTTITCSCRACGSHGENTVTLTVPEAACQSTGYGYPLAQLPPGWIGGYETDSSGNRYVVAQPTSGPQNDLQPYFSIPVQGSRVSLPSKQATGGPAIHDGSSIEPGNNNQPPSAKGEGSHQDIPGSQHGTPPEHGTPPNNSQPEAPEGSHHGSDNSHGSGSETQTTPAPQSDVSGSRHGTALNPFNPGAANSDQQGSDNSRGSGSETQTTPASQLAIPMNSSGSYQGPGNASGSEASNGSGHGEPNNSREGSENSTNSEKETVTISTSKPDMEVRPSGSSNQPEVASTLETKTGGTSKEMNGPESTQTLSASGSEESGKSPLTVSEANGNRGMLWTMIVGGLIIGFIFVFL
ncbi:hypothetical protein FANTH_3684 [Fusarium anthophilum]|uniref:WSC domain-containing protein n=1 Tax=Fusarium anthophilum TaxID=48485 RepID=A0A8H4ZRA0_9HYPO|nr:hypothetical protein FANTH_3684 [Fusarium anthophilum]